MKFLILLLVISSSLSHSDDTEIYGTRAVTTSLKSNVLFIMDTSGSMDGEVTGTQIDFNSNSTYTGSYDSDYFFNDLNDDPSDGIPTTSLNTAQSYNCADTRSKLISEGRVIGYQYDQYRYKNNGRGSLSWRDIRDGNTGDVRCDQGDSESLYSGNYMNWYNSNASTNLTRLDVVRNVVTDLTYSLTNVNLGLMRFDQHVWPEGASDTEGAYIDVPVQDIATSGSLIRTALNGYDHDGGTPLSESLYEAALYYRGETPHYGNSTNPDPSNATSMSGGKYISPIQADCQKNHVILLTDGQPYGDSSANGEIQTLIEDLSLPNGLDDECTGTGECLDEMAYFLQNTDQSNSIVGSQPVSTYTIGGFNLTNGVALLKNTASWGGGEYYAADNTEQLVSALDEIFLKILQTDSTFTAPAVSVNAFNASEHRDELYYALFRPSDTAKWHGNLKRYKLDADGFVLDKNDNIAVSDATGFFNDGIKDFWNNSSKADGSDITAGGMANRLPTYTSRTVYSENTSGDLASFTSVATDATLDMVGEDASDLLDLKNWVLGKDIFDNDEDNDFTDNRYSIGDPLHSEPVVITYGGTDENPDSTIYFGSNEGFIHAVNTESGEELFSFLPTELHGTQKEFYDDSISAGSRSYGMDGPVTTWFKDVNQNNLILDSDDNTEAGEHVYIYAGMRRGGKNYYALNVTDRDAPELLFTIKGGTGNFAKLGQTWSRMTPAKVHFNGTSRFVLFFTGGYDTNQDNYNASPSEDTTGNAIYMVDATTGERLWWSSNVISADLKITDMVNSFPSSISAIDINGDNHVDYFFAADAGGRVFRFDIKSNNEGESDFAIGGMIASVASDNVAGNRRFYNRPSISLQKDVQYGDSLVISLGSGHRAFPISNNDVTDRFYVIKDPYPYSAPPLPEGMVLDEKRYEQYSRTESSSSVSTSIPTDNKLYNATDIMDGTTTLSDPVKRFFNQAAGWYVNIPNTGEKILSESTTFAGAAIFTSFSPSTTATATETCGANLGVSRTYAFNMRWPTAVIDLDGDGDLDSNDVSKVLAHSGIAPRPVVIYREDGAKTIAIGTETIEDDRFQTEVTPDCEGDACSTNEVKQCESANCYVTPVYWRQNETTH